MEAFNSGMKKIQRAFLQPMSKEELEVYFEILGEYSNEVWSEGLSLILRLPYQRLPSAGIIGKILNEIRQKKKIATEVERIRREKAMEHREREKERQKRKPLTAEIKQEIAKITGKWDMNKVITMPECIKIPDWTDKKSLRMIAEICQVSNEKMGEE